MKVLLITGTILSIAGHILSLEEDALVTIEGVDNQDTLAEVLAASGKENYGRHLEVLAHTERRVEGREEKVVKVTYGIGGARQEEVIKVNHLPSAAEEAAKLAADEEARRREAEEKRQAVEAEQLRIAREKADADAKEGADAQTNAPEAIEGSPSLAPQEAPNGAQLS